MKDQHPTLTEIESLGLKSQFNFADGHAYHDLAPSQAAIIDRLKQIWEDSATIKVKEAENRYQEAFWRLAASPSLNGYPFFRICPTASNSIDTVAAWLAEKKMSTALMHPTFDNLFLILKRRGVPVIPLEEEYLHSQTAHHPLESISSDSLFLVNPNNPTGRTLSEADFAQVVASCLKTKKILLLDNTFRFFVAPAYDQYKILLNSGVTFISIEDTGKVWPTQDMKASLVFYSENIAKEIETIYEEIYLCVSNFCLSVLTAFLVDAKSRGLDRAVWQEVETRRNTFREIIKDTAIEIDPIAQNSRLSVEWARINAVFASDLEAANYFKNRDLILLPGRNFFWSLPPTAGSSRNIRFSLLKPRNHFMAAVKALKEGLTQAGRSSK